MPRSDFDLTAYTAELFKDATDLSPEQRAAVEQVLSKEAVRNRLADSVIRQADYSRQTQELASQKKAFDDKYHELEGWYAQQLEQTKRNEELVARLQQENAAYKSQYGEETVPTTQQQPQVDLNKYVPRDTMVQELSRVQSEGVKLMAEMSTLQSRHTHEFKEPLDMDALTTSALKSGRSLSQEYNLQVQERRDAIQAAELKRKLDEAREEGRKAALSEARIPTFPTSTDQIHPFEARSNLGEKSNVPLWKQGVDAFMRGDLSK